MFAFTYVMCVCMYICTYVRNVYMFEASMHVRINSL